MAGKKRTKCLTAVSAALIMSSAFSAFAFADSEKDVPVRTVMLYCFGSNLETDSSYATGNLLQMMDSVYNEDLNLIVLTGGASEWHMPAEYLVGAEEISPDAVQIWKIEGKQDGAEHGFMTLLGTDDEADPSALGMTDPGTLTRFVDSAYELSPADIYDLILWGHGGGPAYGFGVGRGIAGMSLEENISAVKNTELIKSGKTFEFIDYDACIMGNAEVIAAFSGLTDDLICSAEWEYGSGQFYTGWLDAVSADPFMTGYEIGKKMVDDYKAYYEAKEDFTASATLSVVNMENYRTRLLPLLLQMEDIMYDSVTKEDENTGKIDFYDEIKAAGKAYKYGGDDFDLIDIGGFAAALEKAAYKDLTRRMLDVFEDNDGSGDDVIYTGLVNASSSESGSAGDPGPGGISMFFPFDSVEAYDYYLSLKEVIAKMPEGDEKEYLEKGLKNATFYAALRTAEECATEWMKYTDEIPYDIEVLNIFDDWDNCFAEIFSYLESEGYIDSVEDAETTILDFMTDFAENTLMPDKFKAVQIRKGSGEIKGYLFIAEDILEDLIASLAADMRLDEESLNLGFKMFLNFSGYTLYTERNFPDGLNFFTEKNTGERELSVFMKDFSDSEETLLERYYENGEFWWKVDSPSAEYTALYDANGEPHVAFVNYTNEEKTEGYIDIVTLTGLRIMGSYYLYIKFSGDEWEIEGLSENLAPEGERQYLDMSLFETNDEMPTFYSPAGYLFDHAGKKNILLPTGAMAEIAPLEKNWGITIPAARTEDVIEAFYYIKDIFGNIVDFSDSVLLAKDAAEEGEYLTDISDAVVSIAEAIEDGNASAPAVTVVLGERTLKEGEDYLVFYDGSKDVGNAQLLVVGIGKYIGKVLADYEIKAAAPAGGEGGSQGEGEDEGQGESGDQGEGNNGEDTAQSVGDAEPGFIVFLYLLLISGLFAYCITRHYMVKSYSPRG